MSKKEEYEFTIIGDDDFKNNAPKPENINFSDTQVPEPVKAVSGGWTPPQVEEETSATQSCFEWLQAIVTAVVIVVLLLTFVFRLVDVDGESMTNTLHNSDKVFVTSLLYEPKDSDIIVISHGQEYNKPIIKRVIATEGQSVRIDYEKRQVIVDGVVIDEPYIREPMVFKEVFSNPIPDVIPEGMVFVMGDNRNNSLDSRSQQVGLINKDDIIGKAQAIVFPFDRFSTLY